MRQLWADVRQLRLWLQFVGAGSVVCGLSLLLLGPSAHQLLMFAYPGVGSFIVILAGIAIFGSESRLAQLWPAIAGLVGLAAIGLSTSGLGPALGGFYTLIFVYIGLTQRPWTSIALVPIAAVGWLETNRPISHSVVARMPVAVSLWILLAELLSRFSAEREQDKRLLAEQATYDALTGLRNRHGLDELLADARSGDTIAFVDLDHFKLLNDQHGHAAGDQALADLGRTMRMTLRAKDIAVRFGGEEILILLPDTSSADAVAVIERVRETWSTIQPELKFSAGVAVVGPTGGADAARQADTALYLAKDRGRDRTEMAAGREPKRAPARGATRPRAAS